MHSPALSISVMMKCVGADANSGGAANLQHGVMMYKGFTPNFTSGKIFHVRGPPFFLALHEKLIT